MSDSRSVGGNAHPVPPSAMLCCSESHLCRHRLWSVAYPNREKSLNDDLLRLTLYIINQITCIYLALYRNNKCVPNSRLFKKNPKLLVRRIVSLIPLALYVIRKNYSSFPSQFSSLLGEESTSRQMILLALLRLSRYPS
jgi:hypothetical protein